MNANVSYRNMESSPALRDYAVRKLEKITDKYVRGRTDASIVLSVEKFRHIANITLSIKNLTVKGKSQSQDMYSSIDLALEKIEKQLRRHKDRIRDHKPANGESRPFKMGVLSPLGGSPSLAEDSEIDPDFADDYERYPAPEEEEQTAVAEKTVKKAEEEAKVVEKDDGSKVKVLRNSEYEAKPMSVEKAVLQLDLLDDREFFVFNNADSNKINIVYRRDDDNIGLIET